jgi:cytochrome c biogenesis protein CcmG/thiol:disulfide interchange protein DsbE
MTTEKSSGSKTGLIAGIIGGIVVLALVAIVVFATEELGAEYGDPVITGSALPLMPQTAPIDATANGLPAPEVVGQNFQGDTVDIVNDGKAKAIVFLAHWCPHCQVEVPKVQAWLNAGGGTAGVDLYAVATDMDSTRGNFPPSAWLEREGWSGPVVRDDNENSVLTAFGRGGFPFWTFVNADGTVALRTSGEMPVEQLQSIMDSLEQ